MVQTYINLKRMLDSEMGKKQMSLFFHLERAPWHVPLNSDYAKQNLEKLAKQLSFVFPVDFIYEEQNFMGQNHACLSPIGVQWIKGKSDSIEKIELRHVMKYNSKSNLSEGIEFLALAKLVELGFPGFVRKEAKEIRSNYGLIASVLGEPCFHEVTIGRLTKFGNTLAGPAAYPVIRVKKTDYNIQSIYHALREFYIMSLLVENRNIFPVIEWYNFRMFMILLPYIAAKSNDFLTNIGMAALEKHTGLFKKDADFSILFWDQIKEINVLIETHGYKLLLESLCVNNNHEKVKKLFQVMLKLPPKIDTETGLLDEQLIQIFNVVKELCNDLCPECDENIEFVGEFYAIVGNIEIERGYEITFR